MTDSPTPEKVEVDVGALSAGMTRNEVNAILKEFAQCDMMIY